MKQQLRCVLFVVGALFATWPTAAQQAAPAEESHPPRTVSTKAWPQEPDGFAGVKFGTPFSDANAKLWSVSCQDRKIARGPVRECTHPGLSVTRGVNAAATYLYSKGPGNEPVFSGVKLETENKQFKELKVLLIAKYGPPLVSDEKDSISSKFTNARADVVSLWQGENVKVRMRETSQPLRRSSVIIERIPDHEKTDSIF